MKVREVIPQYTISQIGSRGVRLDALAVVDVELLEDCRFGEKGIFVNIEMQKIKDEAHTNRVFYNAASLLVNHTPRGTEYKDLPRVIEIYISSFDIFHDGRMYYEVRRVVAETGKVVESPVMEIYVNTSELDGIDPNDAKMKRIAALMELFKEPGRYDPAFPEFTRRKKEIRETKEGVMRMSQELQYYMDEQVREGELRGKLEGATETVDRMLAKNKYSSEEIADNAGVPLDFVLERAGQKAV